MNIQSVINKKQGEQIMSKKTRWTEVNIPDQTGKVAIVTGANSGIGYEMARALAAKGATVILACRSMDKGNAALEQLKKAHPNANAELMQLDLADLSSVRSFAEKFLAQHDQLHILINNAGVMMIPGRQETADGFEMQFGTNHLGHFALTGLLIETILRTSGARVVTVSSGAHTMGKVEFDNLNAEKSYSRTRVYGLSKLANLLFTYELQRKFEAAGAEAIATASHPGWTATNLQQHSGLFRLLNPIMAMKPPQGALPTLYAAVDTVVNGGEYFGPDGLGGMRGYPKKIKSNDRSYDEAVAAKLWTESVKLTGEAYAALG
jgi:NAD(P)-dependent dehydrogenase (short-subunit alcohol dehydrogenase family)